MPIRIRCGIYCLLNRTTGEAYVGQAKNIRFRVVTHFQGLRTGKHPNKRLQASFNKHGRDAFSVNVLEECPEAELNQKEHDWMLKVRPSLNHLSPDYVAAARGKPTDGRLRRRRRLANREPSRYFCKCGKLKALVSRGCLSCMKAMAAEMITAGYLPADHHFEFEPDTTPSGPAQLRSHLKIQSRIERFGRCEYTPEQQAKINYICSLTPDGRREWFKLNPLGVTGNLGM